MPDEPLVREDEEQGLFELSDIEVSTLGLVTSGMVGETFYLLKSEGGMAVSELDILEEALAGSQEGEKVKKGSGSILERIGVNRLTELIRKGMKAEEELSTSETTVDEGDSEGTEQEGDPVNESANESNEVNKMADVDKQEVVEETVEQESPVTEGVQKGTEVAQGDGDDQQEARVAELVKVANKDVLARLAKFEKQAGEDQVRIAKAEAVANSERDLRERMLFVEKAEKDYPVIPVKADDLGEFLHFLSKGDTEVNIEKAADAEDRVDRLGFVSDIFAAVNEMVLKSGIFKEQGSAKIPEDMNLVEKAEALAKDKKIPFRDAVLELSDAEIKDYLLNN